MKMAFSVIILSWTADGVARCIFPAPHNTTSLPTQQYCIPNCAAAAEYGVRCARRGLPDALLSRQIARSMIRRVQRRQNESNCNSFACAPDLRREHVAYLLHAKVSNTITIGKIADVEREI